MIYHWFKALLFFLIFIVGENDVKKNESTVVDMYSKDGREYGKACAKYRKALKHKPTTSIVNQILAQEDNILKMAVRE